MLVTPAAEAAAIVVDQGVESVVDALLFESSQSS